MAYKLIAIDMDGTLLNAQRMISPRNISAIRAAIDSGVHVILASGRPAGRMANYYALLGLDFPVISCNGAVIINPSSGEMLYEKKLEHDTAAQILAHGRELNTTMFVFSDDKLYVSRQSEKLESYRKNAEQYEKSTFIPPLRIDCDDNLVSQGITKIIWSDDEEKISTWQHELAGKLPKDVMYCTSCPDFLEFWHSETSKGKALAFLGKYYGIAASEMIAIGDGMNDLSMIEYAGLGVAMGNASDTLKQIADFITRTNDDDGVAHVLEKFNQIRLTS